tara:strand:- start:281 stop:424 length:144 start_codon:yes stop_codon:yes gene_type:complete
MMHSAQILAQKVKSMGDPDSPFFACADISVLESLGAETPPTRQETQC